LNNKGFLGLIEGMCLAYVGNVVKTGKGDSGIDSTDDLPFIELVQKVPLSPGLAIP
jgi:hypothetical protein